jgi:murein DD-endopeptidase MepM/ murein hydrolase activator NlpD
MKLENNSFSARGFGHHQWWSVVDGPHAGKWLHYAHADSFVFGDGDIGTIVHRGDKIGECGQSGGQQYVHLHFEVKRGHPMEWGYWGGELKTQEQVDLVYMDPIEFCSDYDAWYDESYALSEQEQSLLNAVRELGFIDHAEPVIRIICGLHANEGSIEGWINEIGALKAQLNSLSTTS